MIRDILFPVDFSPSCVAMAPFVRRASAIFSAKVTMLHVLEPSADSFELLVRPAPLIEDNLRCVAQDRLRSFLEMEFPASECNRILLAGDPATCISETAKERRFDLIIMPTHAGLFRRALLGSTTAKVLNDAECPVMTTQHAQTISAREIGHREWMCTLGLSADSERVLRRAHSLAEAAHANLTLVHALPQRELSVPEELELLRRVESAERQQALNRFRQLQIAVGSNARVDVVAGPVKDSLVQAARRLCADALIIGRSPQYGSHLPDLTYAVVRDAPCPVVSV